MSAVGELTKHYVHSRRVIHRTSFFFEVDKNRRPYLSQVDSIVASPEASTVVMLKQVLCKAEASTVVRLKQVL